MNLRKLRYALLLYAAFDLFIGGTCAGFLPLTPLAAAQFTTVTGTIVDPNGLPYSFGSVNAVLVVPGGTSPTLNGFPYTPPTQPARLDIAGSFTMQLADNTVLQPGGTQWNFRVCSETGATVQPAFGKGSVCFTLATPITISGSSQSITAQLQAAALPLTVPFAAAAGCTPSPSVANSIVFLNGSSNCTTDATLQYFVVGPGGEMIIKSPTGSNGSEPIQIKGTTSGLTAINTTSTGLCSLFRNSGLAQWTICRDTSTSPINYVQWQSGVGNGLGVTATGDGFEWSGAGDTQGSATAAGFKVTNAASTLNNSPGASNSLAAGNAQGTSNSPGGSFTVTAGTASGGGAGDNGGSISHTAGNGSGTNGIGGDVTYTAGNGAGTGRGGNVNFNTGTGSPNGQFLCNGSACFTPTIVASSTTTATGVTVGASNTVVITKAVTFPASGCPCRALITYGIFYTATNSGVVTFWASDGTNNFAPSQVLTNTAGGGNNSAGGNASQVTPVTYANSAPITFTVNGNTNASGSITTGSTSLGVTLPSFLNISILTSN